MTFAVKRADNRVKYVHKRDLYISNDSTGTFESLVQNHGQTNSEIMPSTQSVNKQTVFKKMTACILTYRFVGFLLIFGLVIDGVLGKYADLALDFGTCFEKKAQPKTFYTKIFSIEIKCPNQPTYWMVVFFSFFTFFKLDSISKIKYVEVIYLADTSSIHVDLSWSFQNHVTLLGKTLCFYGIKIRIFLHLICT